MTMKNFSLLFWANLLVSPMIWTDQESTDGYTLVDEGCLIEDQPAFLKSQIEKIQEEKKISFTDAENELLQKRKLWIYAKKQPKFNIAVGDVFKQADDHIQTIMTQKGFSEESFEKALIEEYVTTLNQYRFDIATLILENMIRSSLQSQISISDAEINKEVEKIKHEQKNRYEVVFVSVLGPMVKGKSITADQLTARFKRANEIRTSIKTGLSLDEIKNKYGRSISVIGPYDQDALKQEYKDRLSTHSLEIVTEPFLDNDAVSLIWKIKKLAAPEVDDAALLEKARKRLYEIAVDKLFNSMTSSIDASIPAVKGCQSR